MSDSGAAARRQTVTVDVGGVLVGSGAPGRRPVDDQHGHRRRGRRPRSRSRRSPTPARSWCASRSTTTRPRGRAGDPAQARRPGRRACRSSATSTTTGTSCWSSTRTWRAALAKYRINPGNVGAKRHDENFQTIVRVAIENGKPVRIGVNWGSLDQALLTELMDANARARRAAGRARRDDRGDARSRRCAPRSWPRRPAWRTTGSSCRAKVSGVQRPGRRLPPAGEPLRLPAAPGPDRGGHGHEGHRRVHRRAVASCSRRASATPSACR